MRKVNAMGKCEKTKQNSAKENIGNDFSDIINTLLLKIKAQ